MQLRHLWQRLRAGFWRALAFDVVVIAVVFWAVHAWQTRNLPIDLPAPATRLPLLQGGGSLDAVVPGQVGIVYFFAPWCRVCRASIGNLDSLVDGGAVDWAVVIALDYANPAEVSEFIAETEVGLPVLLGDMSTIEDWSIAAFPTYYVVDATGRVHGRSVGYSTWLGMLWRAWMAAW